MESALWKGEEEVNLSTLDVEKRHALEAFHGAKCSQCSLLAMTRATSWVELKEAVNKNPELLPKLMRGELAPLLHRARDGKTLLRWAVVYACQTHSSDMEKAAARHPDWVYVSIERAPNPTNKVVVGGTKF